MFYDAELSFFQLFLKRLRIGCRLVPDEAELMPELDEKLREFLWSSFPLLNPSAPEWQENTIYNLADPFSGNYIYLLLPDCPRPTALLIGPYLSAPLSAPLIRRVLRGLSASEELESHIIKYYSQFPLLPDNTALYAALGAFGEKIWGGPEFFQTVTPPACSDRSLLESTLSGMAAQDTDAIDMEILEMRYRSENEFLRAVSLGQTKKAEQFLTPFPWGIFEQRSENSLQNIKNYLIILNTLLRKAVEKGQVHPLHIDRLSGSFAIKIDSLKETSAASRLVNEMIHKYCLLVRNHSLKAYSLPVQKVVTNIDYDLTADLSLRAQAELLKINPSYLSTLFKKETGSTLTDYVNKKRVEHAIFLLNSTTQQVQAIAHQCGFPDVNYFTKAFKKIVGSTPVLYRQSILRPDSR